jgi:hypothetical protein
LVVFLTSVARFLLLFEAAAAAVGEARFDDGGGPY